MGSFIPYESRLSKFITECDSTCQLFYIGAVGGCGGIKSIFSFFPKYLQLKYKKLEEALKQVKKQVFIFLAWHNISNSLPLFLIQQ